MKTSVIRIRARPNLLLISTTNEKIRREIVKRIILSEEKFREYDVVVSDSITGIDRVKGEATKNRTKANDIISSETEGLIVSDEPQAVYFIPHNKKFEKDTEQELLFDEKTNYPVIAYNIMLVDSGILNWDGATNTRCMAIFNLDVKNLKGIVREIAEQFKAKIEEI